ncbi:MAG: imidazole glycerol phosphate synthase subunit HisH [Lachnospiraceae bacterium]|nr:imidazole glycerol phosphate synthase subunit HisH [Lachnospiraceae bacterium]
MIAIIDYDAGNIKSVEKALLYLGKEAVITRDTDTLLSAEKVILPGVGSFGDAMGNLERYGLIPVIKKIVENKTPFMGICLGLQLLFDSSEESPGVKGLGILPGKVLRFPQKDGFKVPQIGWNSLSFPKESRLFKGIPEGSFVYFVHSYFLDAGDKSDVAAQSDYIFKFDAAVEKDNVFACQFHPEKSSDVGLSILKNFTEI